MAYDFEKDIKGIENEILALKTASDYASIRSVRLRMSTTVQTGIYRITYASSNEPIFSFVYGDYILGNSNTVWARTPSGNTQVVEVNTDIIAYPSPTYTTMLTVIANREVTSIEKIG